MREALSYYLPSVFPPPPGENTKEEQFAPMPSVRGGRPPDALVCFFPSREACLLQCLAKVALVIAVRVIDLPLWILDSQLLLTFVAETALVPRSKMAPHN